MIPAIQKTLALALLKLNLFILHISESTFEINPIDFESISIIKSNVKRI